MRGLKNNKCNIYRITPNDGYHYFYGYYDNRGLDSSGCYHLCHRVKFYNRLPEPGDICELGLIDIKHRTFSTFGHTTAWNFQQGAMLEYLSDEDDDRVIYNVEENGSYYCVIQTLSTGQKQIAGPAVADVSRDGSWGLAINMSRLFDFRPGYGYCSVADPYVNAKHPEKDGVFIVDLNQKITRQILSYPQISKLFRDVSSSKANSKLVINHITFNPSGKRFVFLVRNFPNLGQRHYTGVATADLDGSNLHIIMEFSPCASHYHWQDNEHLLIYAECRQSNFVRSMLIFRDLSDSLEVFPTELFPDDIHCLYSPNLSFIVVGDGYPNSCGYRDIQLINTRNMESTVLLSAWSDPKSDKDYRCDLHNRWSRDGRYLSFDSTHEGFRGIYIAEIAQLLDVM